jgi:prepilin-type N-terminal cleavage/methylation domain-containing protein
MNKSAQTGFTLVEIAIVLLIVTILLGYTVAMFPQQQKLKQYRALNLEMDRVMEAIIGFAQVNGRLPCPAIPNSTGKEDIFAGGCNNYAGFVPINTLGLNGRLNEDSLLLDPWGNPYRYYVTDVDFDPPPAATDESNGISDFTAPGEMRAVGLVDTDSDTYIDLDGRYLICDSAGSSTNDQCTGANQVFGRYTTSGGSAGTEVRYGGAPFVLLSQGKNWNEAAATGDELENSGATLTPDALKGPTGMKYLLKNVAGGETTFVRRPSGFADDYDDVVRWASPSVLFSRMIKAGQLP